MLFRLFIHVDIMSNLQILNIMLGKGKGGLESVFVSHTRLLSTAGYENAALCHTKSPYIEDLKKINIPVFSMPSSKANPFSWMSLIKTIKDFQPDVLCLHGNRAVCFATSRFLKLFINPFPKLIATAHNDRNKKFYKLDGVFSITQVLKDNLINHFNIPSEKIFLCSNAVPFPKNDSSSSYQSHSPVRIGFCGRFHPVKGLDLLLEACQKMQEQKINFELLVAGDGPLTKDYQRLVRAKSLTEKVHFLGWINDKAHFFDQIDVLCMPSRSEAQSLSLLEALSYAKPVIVSACPGMLEVINNSNCALTFPVEDSEALCEKLSILIQNEQMRAAFSKNAYQLFLAKYNEDVQKENLKSGIDAVCQK